MKFGKRLATEAARQWSPYYLDYKQVKRAIKEDLSRQDVEGQCFQNTLTAELQKVCKFYLLKEQELKALLTQSKLTPGGSVKDLQKEVLDLIKFVALNYVAVVKATKKRNRHMKEAFGHGIVQLVQPYDILCDQVFFTSSELARVATQVDILTNKSFGCDKAPKDVLSDFQCPICLDVLHNPVVLTCTHRFCWGCLITHCATVKSRDEDMSLHKSKGGSYASGVEVPAQLFDVTEVISDSPEPRFFTCPVCRKPHGLDLDGMQIDKALAAFIQDLMSQDTEDGFSEIVEEVEQESSGTKDKRVQQGQLTVLLDLDGTLVSSFTPRRAPHLPSHVRTHLVAKGSQLNPQGVFVVERPGLQEFLQGLSSFANVAVFTAGLEDYAQPIVQAIDPEKRFFSSVIYRDGCLKTEYYQCVKDIAMIGHDLTRTVLVDDTPLAFLHQPENGIPVLPFRGNPDDQLLMDAVLPFLQGLADAPNVQDILRERFDMSLWFKRHGYPVAAMDSQVHYGPSESTFSAISQPAGSTMDCVRPLDSSTVQVAPSSTTSTLLLCDFDNTMVDFDAGERVFETLAPELVPMLQSLEMPANFIPTTNTLLSELTRRGVSRNLLLTTLQEIGSDLPAGTVRMLQHAHAMPNVQVKILSDCNRIFIAHMLAGAKVGNLVKEVLTNPASFERVEESCNISLGSSSGRVGRKGCMQKLVVAPRHAAHLPAHGCSSCPENLCKGQELDKLRAQKPCERIVFCGDGANDICPAKRLRAGDFVLARQDYALAKFLQADAASGTPQMKAWIKIWEHHEQLADMVCALLQ